ncbi:hypothetical protein LQD23_16700 [Chromobacterium violaceum]|uniref:hypothetical protein n=1 Tax=Chromobacterium violaceum TaxID=536 RepID=UPI001E3A25EA|nr:hypothetical protein [Chromobacterium violaceum]MCD0493922.1 hypothetical protein [Chromobacterium violaceum]
MQTQPQRPIRNAEVIAAAFLVAAAVERLTKRGMAVLSVEMEPPRPTIRILKHESCVAMIKEEKAAYFGFDQDTYFGKYRQGQFQLNGCRVVWDELDA